MSANKFTIAGNPTSVDSYRDFFALEKGKLYENILFFPDIFNETPENILKQKEIIYRNVSFKDTTFTNVSFVYCTFDGCLLLSSKFIDCEFIDCKFINTNTNKARFTKTLIDPKYFTNNFDLKNDTNIAADLYHELYKNLSNERQPDRAKESLYLMHRAENAHLSSQLQRKRITTYTFFIKKIWHFFNFLTTGYGLKLYRVLLTLFFVVGLFSYINYTFNELFFEPDMITTYTDSLYFTLVTLTTVGYGDISPCTQIGKIAITIQVMIGIIVISLFLSSISSRAVRA